MNRFRFKMRNESMKNSCIIFCPEFFFQLAEGIKISSEILDLYMRFSFVQVADKYRGILQKI